MFDDRDLPLSRVVAQEVMVHELRARNPGAAPDEKDPFRLLGPRTRVAYKATHDVLRMTGGGIVTRSFVHRNRADMACSVWEDGLSDPLVIPWSCTEWPTFWHQDLYTAFWNKGMAVVRQIASEKADLQGPDLALVLLVYRVAAALAALEARPGIPTTFAEDLLHPRASGSKTDSWRVEELGSRNRQSPQKTTPEIINARTTAGEPNEPNPT